MNNKDISPVLRRSYDDWRDEADPVERAQVIADMTEPVNRCPGHNRHWFTVYGAPGLRSPRCQRCGADNPRPLSPDELLDYEDHMQASDRYHRENRDG